MPPDPHRSSTADHVAGRGGVFLDVEWSADSDMLAFVSSSRDHKSATLRLADPDTGDVRTVYNETVATYMSPGIAIRTGACCTTVKNSSGTPSRTTGPICICMISIRAS